MSFIERLSSSGRVCYGRFHCSWKSACGPLYCMQDCEAFELLRKLVRLNKFPSLKYSCKPAVCMFTVCYYVILHVILHVACLPGYNKTMYRTRGWFLLGAIGAFREHSLHYVLKLTYRYWCVDVLSSCRPLSISWLDKHSFERVHSYSVHVFVSRREKLQS